MSEPSKAELLEEIELIKQELAHVRRQMEKKSYQASVYSKMMHSAMRHLEDEWFPFRGLVPSPKDATPALSRTGNETAQKLADRWKILQERISVRVRPR